MRILPLLLSLRVLRDIEETVAWQVVLQTKLLDLDALDDALSCLRDLHGCHEVCRHLRGFLHSSSRILDSLCLKGWIGAGRNVLTQRPVTRVVNLPSTGPNLPNLPLNGSNSQKKKKAKNGVSFSRGVAKPTADGIQGLNRLQDGYKRMQKMMRL